MPSPQPQLFMLYNTRFHALTIRDHVEHLRKHGFVWWGRFYNGPTRFDAAAARARWGHVAQLAGERTLSGEPSLVFASDFQALHVFKVTDILFGDDPGEGVRAEALAHYADKSVPIWFRVEDSCAISYEHGKTNDWLTSRFGPVLGGSTRGSGEPFHHAYDPTGAVLHQFPIVIEGPAWQELFHPRNLPRGLKRQADALDAMSPKPVQEAFDHLGTVMDPRVWKRASSQAKEEMAQAWVSRADLAKEKDVDPSDGFNHVARAVEIELRDELLGALEALVKKRGAARLERAIDAARGTDSRGGRMHWMLGSCVVFVKDCASKYRRELTALGVGEVAELGSDAKWVKGGGGPEGAECDDARGEGGGVR